MKNSQRRQYLERKCEDFNKRYPVGTPVQLRRDSGTIEKTKVRHPAYVLSGHSAVAFFEGISGCYSIEGDRVKPILEEKCDPISDVREMREKMANDDGTKEYFEKNFQSGEQKP